MNACARRTPGGLAEPVFVVDEGGTELTSSRQRAGQNPSMRIVEPLAGQHLSGSWHRALLARPREKASPMHQVWADCIAVLKPRQKGRACFQLGVAVSRLAGEIKQMDGDSQAWAVVKANAS